MKKRNSYTREFKVEAVRLLEQGDKSPTDLALDLDVKRSLLYRWQEQLNKQGDSAFRGAGRRPDSEMDAVARLRKQLSEVTEERDILKKAAAYFARDLK
jgi:transposase